MTPDHSETTEGSSGGEAEGSDAQERSAPLAALAKLLDQHVVAHSEVKEALLLALVTREHIYIEGPPGTAKTRLAEIAAKGCGLEFFFYQLHRDTRLAELVGDIVLERRPIGGGDGAAGDLDGDAGAESGERIHQRIEPGGLLVSEVCVLDDISRAPGEALNVLLRLLNERQFGSEKIPLLSAIATGNPMDDEYYNEPLDPANLDRFALQLKVRGLIHDGEEAARELIDRFASGDVEERPEPAAVVTRADLDQAYAALSQVTVPDRVRAGLLEVLRTLVVDQGCDESNSLLTDRSFLVKAVKLVRGRALLRGRSEAVAEDLDVLQWMTTFRVPEEVVGKVPAIVDGVVQKVG